jgi:putative flippase GtrA
MLAKAHDSHADLVIAKPANQRERSDGPGAVRKLASRAVARVTKALLPLPLRNITDRNSIFFLARKDVLPLSPPGRKDTPLLLQILLRGEGLRVTEVTYGSGGSHPDERQASLREPIYDLITLLRFRLGDSLPRLTRFVTVGASGLLVNSALLFLATDIVGIHYLVSAALATQGSTLWNFAFTEGWVFPDRAQSRPRLPRLAKFFLMNNAAYLLRGPILFTFTSILGLHYLLSNLLSIGILTLVRFTLSSLWIWRKG